MCQSDLSAKKEIGIQQKLNNIFKSGNTKDMASIIIHQRDTSHNHRFQKPLISELSVKTAE